MMRATVRQWFADLIISGVNDGVPLQSAPQPSGAIEERRRGGLACGWWPNR